MIREEFTCHTIDPPEGSDIAAWKRTCVVDKRGTLYLPGFLAADELIVMLSAGFDGVECAVIDDHRYYPAEWMAREWAHMKPVAEAVTARLRREGSL
jgi:hypothetical protein